MNRFYTCYNIDLARNPPDGVSVGLVDDNLFKWELMIIGPADTLYEGGFFKALLEFPNDFPNMPPVMTFTSEMWHPNVFEDGKVCISILHPPGEDKFNEQESAMERWRPILGVEQIIISVISMLSDPNDVSPANIDAAVSVLQCSCTVCELCVDVYELIVLWCISVSMVLILI